MPVPAALAVAAPYIAQAIPAAANAISRGGPRRQYKWNKRAAEDTDARNRKIQEEQRVYDSPKNQMARFIEAGLNPHLIYGGGSGSSGGSFPFQAQPAQAPDASYGNIGTEYIQAGQTAAQTQLTQQKTNESIQNTALKQTLTDIAKTNPMLKPDVANWVATSMQETARLKTIESRAWMNDHSKTPADNASHAELKIHNSITEMEKSLGLLDKDLQIKNKIYESKDFQNALLEVQKNWLEDGDITPQHIFQGLMLILQGMMR